MYYNLILENHPSIFTGITYNIFDPPPGFCFDNICGDKRISEPINGFKINYALFHY